MARNLTSIPDIVPANSDYPNGRIQNENPPVVGTPVIEELYGDIVQFFHKLMRLAGLSHNGLPENETQGFQFITSLTAFVRTVTASITQRGAVELATDAETQAGLDSARVVTPAGIESKTATTSRRGISYLASNAEVVAGTEATKIVTPASLHNKKSSSSVIGLIKQASTFDVGNNYDITPDADLNPICVPPSQLNRVLDNILKKRIDIGGWDMVASTNVYIAHGLTFADIRSATVYIVNDSGTYTKNILSGEGSNYPGSIGWDSTNILLVRGGLFNSTDFNNSAVNRGYIIIEYVR